MAKIFPYNEKIAAKKGEVLDFQDLSIMLKEVKDYTFVVSDTTRNRTEYIFEVTYSENGVKNTKKISYNYGFPGGLLTMPLITKVGRRKSFAIYINVGQPIGLLVKEDDVHGPGYADYGKEVVLGDSTVLEYPDFDLSIEKMFTTKMTYTKSQLDKLIKDAIGQWSEGYKKQNLPVPKDIEEQVSSFFQKVYNSHLIFKIKSSDKNFEFEIVNGTGSDFSVGNKIFSVRLSEYYLDEKTQTFTRQPRITVSEAVIQ